MLPFNNFYIEKGFGMENEVGKMAPQANDRAASFMPIVDFYSWQRNFLAAPKGGTLRRFAFFKMLKHAKTFDQLKWLLSWTLPGTSQRDAVLNKMLSIAKTIQELRFIWGKTNSETTIEHRVLARIVARTNNPFSLLGLAQYVVSGGKSAEIIQVRMAKLSRTTGQPVPVA